LKSIKKNSKTSQENYETASSPLSSFREEGKMVDNQEIFKRLKVQDLRIVVTPPRELEVKPNPTPVENVPVKPKLTSLFSSTLEPLHHL
jgi:hypothetical protein